MMFKHFFHMMFKHFLNRHWLKVVRTIIFFSLVFPKLKHVYASIICPIDINMTLMIILLIVIDRPICRIFSSSIVVVFFRKKVSHPYRGKLKKNDHCLSLLLNTLKHDFISQASKALLFVHNNQENELVFCQWLRVLDLF